MAPPIAPRPMTPTACFEGNDFLPAINPPLAKLASPLIRGAKNRAHFFFFFDLDFFETFFEEPPTGFALTSTAATMQGSLVRTLQEWLVPRCTRMSPAFNSFS